MRQVDEVTGGQEKPGSLWWDDLHLRRPCVNWRPSCIAFEALRPSFFRFASSSQSKVLLQRAIEQPNSDGFWTGTCPPGIAVEFYIIRDFNRSIAWVALSRMQDMKTDRTNLIFHWSNAFSMQTYWKHFFFLQSCIAQPLIHWSKFNL